MKTKASSSGCDAMAEMHQIRTIFRSCDLCGWLNLAAGRDKSIRWDYGRVVMSPAGSAKTLRRCHDLKRFLEAGERRVSLQLHACKNQGPG